jgi:hypothetical protein
LCDGGKLVCSEKINRNTFLEDFKKFKEVNKYLYEMSGFPVSIRETIRLLNNGEDFPIDYAFWLAMYLTNDVEDLIENHSSDLILYSTGEKAYLLCFPQDGEFDADYIKSFFDELYPFDSFKSRYIKYFDDNLQSFF